MAAGKNTTLKKGKGKQYQLLYNIIADRKNIGGEGDGNFGEENKIFKMGLGKNIKTKA